MTTKESEVQELLGVLEDIRAREYPDIPAQLIEDIVNNEFEQQDDQVKAQKNTKKLIDDFMKTVDEA